MFEQSILSNANKAKRIWTASLGVTGQALLVGAMIVVPLFWPEAIPRAAFALVVPAAPPGTRNSTKTEGRPHRFIRPARPFQYNRGFTQPNVIPAVALRIVEPLEATYSDAAVIGGIGQGGSGNGNSLIDSIINSAGELPRPAPAPQPVIAEKPKPAPTETPRIRVGGVVKEPILVRRIDPRYPDIARHAGISGAVRLTGVIGVDGHIRDLAVVSGNPLLTPAAVEAVRQWLYQPTRLNGEPIEVITEIVVTFTLSR